ncbi:recombinase RecA, partial [Niallia endozanthoxylica]
MERRMRGNSHVRCGPGEKVEIASKPYLSVL